MLMIADGPQSRRGRRRRRTRVRTPSAAATASSTGDASPPPTTVAAGQTRSVQTPGTQADAALDHLHVKRLQAGLITPAPDLLLGVPRCVWRVIPVEVDEVADALTEFLVPEALEEGPVDEPLDIVLAGLEAEQRDSALQRDGGVQAGELATELGHLLAELHALVDGEAGRELAHLLVGDLA